MTPERLKEVLVLVARGVKHWSDAENEICAHVRELESKCKALSEVQSALSDAEDADYWYEDGEPIGGNS